MPSLPPEEDDPNTLITRVRLTVREVAGPYSLRYLLLGVTLLATITAPAPWSSIGALSCLGLAIDIARLGRKS